MESKITDNVLNNLQTYSPLYNQYVLYPSLIKRGWIDYYYSSFEANQKNIRIFKAIDNESAVLVRLIDSDWDYEHFGFKVAKIDNPIVINKCMPKFAEDVLVQSLNDCKKRGVRLVVSRVNGDNLTFIHALERSGFKYYENIIWAVAELSEVFDDRLDINNISVFNPSVDDLNEIKHIAFNNQYQRGHYHCDEKISKESANSLYAQWVQSAYDTGKLIVLVKDSSQIAGYFICEIDEKLNTYFGVKYGRLQSLAIDTSFRGKGLGKKLFEGTLNILNKAGCKYVDSGYATKNHISAKLHTEHKFMSVYEEITMHLWI